MSIYIGARFLRCLVPGLQLTACSDKPCQWRVLELHDLPVKGNRNLMDEKRWQPFLPGQRGQLLWSNKARGICYEDPTTGSFPCTLPLNHADTHRWWHILGVRYWQSDLRRRKKKHKWPPEISENAILSALISLSLASREAGEVLREKIRLKSRRVGVQSSILACT